MSNPRRNPPTKPRRRVYNTGESLPELTTDFRPIPLGYDEQGNPDEQVRAFALNIRNRSDSPVYIREGNEGDAAVIDRFENYTIYETNGVSSIQLRGENGGEAVEIRSLEAHNDFSVRDKVEALARAISHFFATNKQETVITGAETVFNTSLQEIGEVTMNTDIQSVGEGVTFDVNLQGSDVQELSVSLDAQNIENISTDISAQSIGDISVLDRTGDTYTRFLRDTSNLLNFDEWTLYENVGFDGLINSVNTRIRSSERLHATEQFDRRMVSVEIDRGSTGEWEVVTPTEYMSALNIYLGTRNNPDEGYIGLYDEENQISWGYEPRTPIRFREGDSVRIRSFHGVTSSGSNPEFDIEISVSITERIGE